MASGKKNYFRHSFNARKDPKIMSLIINHGKAAYFHYWALVELCAESANDNGFPENETFVFHKRTICGELMVTPQRLSGHLLAIQSSLLGDLVAIGERVEIKFPKLRKYLGRYDDKFTPNSPNKRKEKEIKEKEIKLKNIIKKTTQKKSLLAFLFQETDAIQDWLLTGSEASQKELLNNHSHHVLAEEVKKAYLWQCEKKARKAGSFLITWMNNKKTFGLGANQAQKSFSGKRPIGVTPSPENPTGNPYLQEMIERGIS